MAAVVGSVTLLGLAPSSALAAQPGQCLGGPSDLVDAPGVGGSAAFVMGAPVTSDGTKVKSVKFNSDTSLTVVSTDSTATQVVGGWAWEGPNGPNPAKKGVANFVTLVTRLEPGQDGTPGAVTATYQTVFTVTNPLCNPGNLVKPTNVFEIIGTRTTTYTARDSATGAVLRSQTGADAAYLADR
ncbi:hypothetical protein ACIQWR_40385 [Streptomyces sp. NPDC098789]|uniref:hypothetical protein n=1 Tax=Streptomyces sp. NPDC098789 TaxID=3366098 RepID=UPI003801D199